MCVCVCKWGGGGEEGMLTLGTSKEAILDAG